MTPYQIKLAEEIEKKAKEPFEWRDSELSRTDVLMAASDYPYKAQLEIYRQALRDWPASEQFPETRPEIQELSFNVYTKLEFMDLLTDAVNAEIVASTDPMIKVIEKRFDAVSKIYSNDTNLAAALNYLLAAEDIPSMTQEIIDSIVN